jgi:hypothetical protein
VHELGGDPCGDDSEGDAASGFEEEEEFDVGEGGCGSARGIRRRVGLGRFWGRRRGEAFRGRRGGRWGR